MKENDYIYVCVLKMRKRNLYMYNGLGFLKGKVNKFIYI